jgi:hypothetical protein
METNQTGARLKVIMVRQIRASSSLPFLPSDAEIGKDEKVGNFEEFGGT